MCSKKVKETALVRPCLEYASGVLGPLSIISNTMIFRKYKEEPARWTLLDYNRCSSVNNVLTQLQWSSLDKQRSGFTESYMTQIYP